MIAWLQLLGGGLLLYFGAGWLIGGASDLARALRVPQVIIGLTIVAYGSSAPELIVGVQAASAGHGDVALGNIIGSNVVNIGLIFALSVLIRPIHVDASLRTRELPMLVASAAVLPLVFFDGQLSSWELGGLLLAALLYGGWMVSAARQAQRAAALGATTGAAPAPSGADPSAAEASADEPLSLSRAALLTAVGLALVLWGGHTFVLGAIDVAQSVGMSERLVGLTVVAVGTSLPELMTGVMAAWRGQVGLVVGTVVGSNIFNSFVCLGAAGLAGPVAAPLDTLGLDLLGLGVMTGVAALSIRRERVISRWEGALIVLLYGGLTVLMLMRG